MSKTDDLPNRKPHHIRTKTAVAENQKENYFPLDRYEFVCNECDSKCTVTKTRGEVGHHHWCGNANPFRSSRE